jgi:hypothetical protein
VVGIGLYIIKIHYLCERSVATTFDRPKGTDVP